MTRYLLPGSILISTFVFVIFFRYDIIPMRDGLVFRYDRLTGSVALCAQVPALETGRCSAASQ